MEGLDAAGLRSPSSGLRHEEAAPNARARFVDSLPTLPIGTRRNLEGEMLRERTSSMLLSISATRSLASAQRSLESLHRDR